MALCNKSNTFELPLFSEIFQELDSGLHGSASCTVTHVQCEEDLCLAPERSFEFLEQFAALQIWLDVSDAQRLQRNRRAVHALVCVPPNLHTWNTKPAHMEYKTQITRTVWCAFGLGVARIGPLCVMAPRLHPLRARTHHRLQREDFSRSFLRPRAVAPRWLPALRRLQLGSPDIGPPPDAGEQPGRPAHRVVARTGHLLVPGLHGAARDVRRGDRDEEEEFGEHLRVRCCVPLNPRISSRRQVSPL